MKTQLVVIIFFFQGKTLQLLPSCSPRKDLQHSLPRQVVFSTESETKSARRLFTHWAPKRRASSR